MQIELNLVLNWTGSKFFGKVSRIKKKPVSRLNPRLHLKRKKKKRS
jgi:hypothetical protein